jgi:hypothetical protein
MLESQNIFGVQKKTFMLKTPLTALRVLILFCLIISCDSEDEGPDTSAPEITVISPLAGTKVNGTIAITAKVEDRSKNTTVQVYFDDVLVGEEVTTQITTSFNTKSVLEGPHAVKITATDDVGNSSTQTIDIEVRNTLFKLEVPSNLVDENVTVYFILSKKDGSLIAYERAQNNTTISVPTPGNFNADSSFMVTRFTQFAMEPTDVTSGYLFKSVDIHTGIEAGEFKLPELGSARSSVGTHHLDVSDIPSQNIGRIAGAGLGSIYGNFGSDGFISKDLDMYEATSDLFFTMTALPDGEPVYKYINTIEPNGSTAFSFTDLPVMSKGTLALGESSESVNVIITGMLAASKPGAEVYRIDGGSGQEFPLYIPGSSYPEYRFDISINLPNAIVYRNNLYSSAMPTSLQYLDAGASATFSNNTLNISPTGSFDVGSIMGGSSSFENNMFTGDFYTVYFEKGTSSVIMPQLPQEVLDYNVVSVNNIDFSYVSLFDFTSIENSNDYQHKFVFSDDGIFPMEHQHISKQFALSSSGRKPYNGVTMPAKLCDVHPHVSLYLQGE